MRRRQVWTTAFWLVYLGLAGCTSPPAASHDPVRVTLDAASYPPGQAIGVAIVNDGAAVVYADDQQTDCSPIMLERREQEKWTPLNNCGSERAPQVVTFPSGERREIQLDPTSTNFSAVPLTAGAYRVVFEFRTTAQPQGTGGQRIYSPTFTVS